MAIATFAAGCFWDVQHKFQRLDGVQQATAGYSGGAVAHPSYEEVSSGETGHAESVQVEFDNRQVSYEILLKFFWECHDATTLNRQGVDVGSQYRSVVFFHSPEQKWFAERVKEALQATGQYTSPIVTELTPAGRFYVAEEYHQNYFQKKGLATCPLKTRE